MTSADDIEPNNQRDRAMDSNLRRDCLRLFEACLAQIRSGMPGPSLLVSREFEATLMSLCERLMAEGEGNRAHMPRDEEFLIQLIVAADLGDARDGLKTLRKWLKGSTEAVLCDPYLLSFKPSALFPTVDSYAEAIAGLFPKSVTKIDLYSNSYSKKVRPAVLEALKPGRNVRHFSSDQLHDRFLLKDKTGGKVLGTSLGGFGRKFFAVVDLDPADVSLVSDHLQALCPNPLFHRG